MESKTIICIFQATNKWNLTQEKLDMANRETKSLLIAAKNNAIRTYYVKTRMEK